MMLENSLAVDESLMTKCEKPLKLQNFNGRLFKVLSVESHGFGKNMHF